MSAKDADLRARAAEMASKVGCCGQFEANCDEAAPDQLMEWCAYCVLGALAASRVPDPPTKNDDAVSRVDGECDAPTTRSTAKIATSGAPALICSTCDEVVDPKDVVCGNCYDASRHELPEAVALSLTRADCHTILGYLMSHKKLVDLRIRFATALDVAAAAMARTTGENFAVDRADGTKLDGLRAPTSSDVVSRVPDQGWQAIATAPKGGGAEDVRDPKYVQPPNILVALDDGAQAIVYWDWYYAEGGSGFTDGRAWVLTLSGELLSSHASDPTHWRPLPAPPSEPPT